MANQLGKLTPSLATISKPFKSYSAANKCGHGVYPEQKDLLR